jgi:hypothetical protein
MRGLLACCALFVAGCSAPEPVAKPSFDLAGMKPTADGDAATLTGWFTLEGRAFTLYPTLTKPASNAPCLSGVLLSLAGMVTPEYTNRPMTVSGYVFDAKDPAAEGAANPCQSSVIIEAIDVMVPDA